MHMYNKFIIGLSLFCLSLLLVCNSAFADGGHSGGSGHFGGNGSVPSYQDDTDSAPTFQEYNWSVNDKSIDFDTTTDDFLDSFNGKYFSCNANAFLKSDAYKNIINKGYRLVLLQTQYANFDIYFFVESCLLPYYTVFSTTYDLSFITDCKNYQHKMLSCLVYRYDKNTYLYTCSNSNLNHTFTPSLSFVSNQPIHFVNGSIQLKYSISKIPVDSFINSQYLFFVKPFLNFDNPFWLTDVGLFDDFYNSNFNINYIVKNDVPVPLKTSFFDSDYLTLIGDKDCTDLAFEYIHGEKPTDNVAGEIYYLEVSISALYNTTSKEDYNTIISDDGKSYLYKRDYTKSSDYYVSGTGNLVADTIFNVFGNSTDTSTDSATSTFYKTGLNSPFLNCGLFNNYGSNIVVNMSLYEDKLVKLCSQYASLSGKSPYVSISAYVFKLRNVFLSKDKKMSNMVASKPVYYVYSSSGINQFMTVDECIAYGFLPSNYKDTSADINFDGTSSLTDKDKLIINNIINPSTGGGTGGQGGQGGQGGSSSVGDININVEGSTASANNEGVTVNGAGGGGSGNYGGIDLDSGSLSNFGGTVKDINNGWGLLGSNGAIAALSTFWGWFDKQGVITNILIYLILFAVVIGLIKIIRG